MSSSSGIGGQSCQVVKSEEIEGFIFGPLCVPKENSGYLREQIREKSGVWVQIKICTKTDTDSLSRLNSSFSLALNHSSSSSYINLLL